MTNFIFPEADLVLHMADESGEFNLKDAIEYCTGLYDNWRLPTVDECSIIMSENRTKKKYGTNNHFMFEEDKLHLTSSKDSFNNKPLCYDFSKGMAFLSSELAYHRLRLVRQRYTEIATLQKADVINKIIPIFQKYIDNLDELKFTSFLEASLKHESDFIPWRYLVFEDYNLSQKFSLDYPAHFQEDMEMISAWENDWYDAGFSIYDLGSEDDSDDEDLRDAFLGIIDLKKNKYFRMNGYGQVYEYGEDPPLLYGGRQEKTPNWVDWRI
jgi:hypothetical protein